MQGTILALLGSLFLMLGAPRLDAQWNKPIDAQWYKVPASGHVTFALSEFWAICKGPPPSNFVEGDATITLQFVGGSTEGIAFQGSGFAVWLRLQSDHLWETFGTSDWAQTVGLTPGSQFRIMSASPAQQYNEATAFQGGQFGAYAIGRVAKISINAVQVNSGTSGQSATQPPVTISQRASSHIHAVIVSGLADPARVITSPNVTLTGGIVALGKSSSGLLTPSLWSPGLKIIPDYALLTGEKIPPVTPNIIDVRIVRQDTVADFPTPTGQPTH